MVEFLHGATAMGCAVASLFFFRFWNEARDRLFAFFGWAFALLAINYGTMPLPGLVNEWRVPVFVVRLIAFGLILYGIVDKNRP
jgi:Family of unknown function (DUF5985)